MGGLRAAARAALPGCTLMVACVGLDAHIAAGQRSVSGVAALPSLKCPYLTVLPRQAR